MDQIKEAFVKVKSDIDNLKTDISDIKKELSEIQNSILKLFKTSQNILKTTKKTTSTHKQETPTLRHINTTDKTSSTHSSTHKYPFQSLKEVNMDISTGNEGVSTDRQTDRQTNTSTHNLVKTIKKELEIDQIPTSTQTPSPSLVLDQLDAIKKELRLKIKRLTTQEMLVLSSIYQFEDQGQIVDYALLSQNLNLSESSIRDYVKRIIVKGIPLIKEKINNKRIILHISDDLRKLATLNTLISLREL